MSLASPVASPPNGLVKPVPFDICAGPFARPRMEGLKKPCALLRLWGATGNNLEAVATTTCVAEQLTASFAYDLLTTESLRWSGSWQQVDQTSW
jgi:hypothetical protein